MANGNITVKITEDNSRKVIDKLQANLPAAMDAMGIKSINLILWQMQQGYGKPIRQTGDLQRSMTYAVDDNVLTVGTNLEYGIWVHDGTRKMDGRPFIRDGIYPEQQVDKILRVGAAYLKKGFDT